MCKVRFNQFYKYTLFIQSTYFIVGVPLLGLVQSSANNRKRKLEGRNEETINTSTVVR